MGVFALAQRSGWRGALRSQPLVAGGFNPLLQCMQQFTYFQLVVAGDISHSVEARHDAADTGGAIGLKDGYGLRPALHDGLDAEIGSQRAGVLSSF